MKIVCWFICQFSQCMAIENLLLISIFFVKYNYQVTLKICSLERVAASTDACKGAFCTQAGTSVFQNIAKKIKINDCHHIVMSPVVKITSQVFDLEELIFFNKTQPNPKPTNKKSKPSDMLWIRCEIMEALFSLTTLYSQIQTIISRLLIRNLKPVMYIQLKD